MSDCCWGEMPSRIDDALEANQMKEQKPCVVGHDLLRSKIVLFGEDHSIQDPNAGPMLPQLGAESPPISADPKERRARKTTKGRMIWLNSAFSSCRARANTHRWLPPWCNPPSFVCHGCAIYFSSSLASPGSSFSSFSSRLR
jgi:hypothetical protein